MFGGAHATGENCQSNGREDNLHGGRHAKLSGGPTETLYKCGDRSRGGTHANQTTQETPPVNKFEDQTQTNGGIHARKSGGIHANHQEDKNAQERPPVYKCGD